MGKIDVITKDYIRRPDIHTNFREVMKCIKYSKDKIKLGKMINNDERFKNVERQAADVINVVTGTKIRYSGKG